MFGMCNTFYYNFFFLNEIDIRAAIKYFHLKHLKAKEIKSEFDSTLGKSSLAHTTIKRWLPEFKMGCSQFKDEPHGRCLAEATTLEIIEEICKIVE